MGEHALTPQHHTVDNANELRSSWHACVSDMKKKKHLTSLTISWVDATAIWSSDTNRIASSARLANSLFSLVHSFIYFSLNVHVKSVCALCFSTIFQFTSDYRNRQQSPNCFIVCVCDSVTIWMSVLRRHCETFTRDGATHICNSIHALFSPRFRCSARGTRPPHATTKIRIGRKRTWCTRPRMRACFVLFRFIFFLLLAFHLCIGVQ